MHYFFLIILNCYKECPDWFLISKFFYGYYKSNFSEDLLEFNFPNYKETIKPLFLRKRHRNPALIGELLDGYHNFYKHFFPEKNIQQIYWDFYRKHFNKFDYFCQHNLQIFEKLKSMNIKKIPGRVIINESDIKHLEGLHPVHLKIWGNTSWVHRSKFNKIPLASIIPTEYLRVLHLKDIKIGSFSSHTIEEFFGCGVEGAVYKFPNLKKLSFVGEGAFSKVFPLSKKVEFISTNDNCKFCDPGLHYDEPLESIKSLAISRDTLSRSNFFGKKISTIKIINANYLFLNKYSVHRTLKLFQEAHLSLFDCDKLYLYYDCNSYEKRKTIFDLGNFYEFLASLGLKKLKVHLPFEGRTYISNITKLFDIAPSLKIKGDISCVREKGHHTLKNPFLLEKVHISISPPDCSMEIFEAQEDRDYFLETLSFAAKLKFTGFNARYYHKIALKNFNQKLYSSFDFHDVLKQFQAGQILYGLVLGIDLYNDPVTIKESEVVEFSEHLVASKITYLTLSIAFKDDRDLAVLEIIVAKIDKADKFFKNFKCVLESDGTKDKEAKRRIDELRMNYKITPEIIWC